MNSPLLELFEGLQRDFASMTLDELTDWEVNKGGAVRLDFWGAVRGTPLAPVYDDVRSCRAVVADAKMPLSLRESKLAELKYKLGEAVAALRAGHPMLRRKRLREEVVNRVTDAKVRQLCVELNSTPDQNVLALAQLLGETLKWALWQKAKANKTALKESVGLDQLLDETIKNSYYTSNAGKRFLDEFKNNFMKKGYDMVRHSETYIPDIAVLNPQIDALETIIEETF